MYTDAMKHDQPKKLQYGTTNATQQKEHLHVKTKQQQHNTTNRQTHHNNNATTTPLQHDGTKENKQPNFVFQPITRTQTHKHINHQSTTKQAHNGAQIQSYTYTNKHTYKKQTNK